VSLYLRLLSASLRARLQYKWDFVVSGLFYALLSAVDFLTVAAIMYRFPRVGGWGFAEIALLAGLSGTSFGLFRVLCAELWTFEKYLVTGEFDSLLTRPWPTLMSLLARNFDLGRVGAMLQGVLLMVIGLKGVRCRRWTSAATASTCRPLPMPALFRRCRSATFPSTASAGENRSPLPGQTPAQRVLSTSGAAAAPPS